MRARLAKAGRGPTIIELLIIRAGTFKAGELLMYLHYWVKAVHKYGEKASGDQLAEMAKVSSRAGYKYLDELRQALGDEDLAITTRYMLEVVGPHLDKLAALDEQAARRKAETADAKVSKERDRSVAAMAQMHIPGVAL